MSRTITAKPDAKLTETVDQVNASGERIAVRKGGRVVAGVVSADDLRLLEEMDRRDVEAIRRAEADAAARGEKPIPWPKACKILDL